MWGTAGCPGRRGRVLVAGSVGKKGEAAGSGIVPVCALYLVSCVRACARAVGCVMCPAWWCRRVVLDAQVAELPGWLPRWLKDVCV